MWEFAGFGVKIWGFGVPKEAGPVSKAFPRLTFVVMFSFISTKANG